MARGRAAGPADGAGMKIATPPPMRGFWWFNAVAWSLYAGLSMFMAATFAAFSSAIARVSLL